MVISCVKKKKLSSGGAHACEQGGERSGACCGFK